MYALRRFLNFNLCLLSVVPQYAFRRFGDIVAAAEEHLGLCAHDQMAEDRGKRHPPRVLAAFCDGSSIM